MRVTKATLLVGSVAVLALLAGCDGNLSGDTGAPGTTTMGPTSKPASLDADGDGDPASTDCDDSDPLRASTHEESYYNGIDDDCDPLTIDDDQDGDGDPVASDGDDLDPGRSSIRPDWLSLATGSYGAPHVAVYDGDGSFSDDAVYGALY